MYDLCTYVIITINMFQKRFHGKGTVEFEDGSFIMGYWLHGIKQGHFKVNLVGSVGSLYTVQQQASRPVMGVTDIILAKISAIESQSRVFARV